MKRILLLFISALFAVCSWAENPKQEAYDYIVSLIGDKTYAGRDGIFLMSVNEDGELMVLFDNVVMGVYSSEDVLVNDNEFLFTSEDPIKFVVEDGVIAHIYAMYSTDEIAFEFFEEKLAVDYEHGTVEDYDYIVSLVGDKRYESTGGQFVISVSADGELQMSSVNGIFVYEYDYLVVNDNEFLFKNWSSIKFVVEDGVIAHIYAMNGSDDIAFEFFEQVSPYEQLVSLVGDKVYEANGVSICLAEDRKLHISYGPSGSFAFEEEFVIALEDGYFIEHYGLKFVVEDGVISHVYAMGGDDILFEFIEQSSVENFEPGTVEDYEYIVSLVGDNRYVMSNVVISVNEDGELQVDFGEEGVQIYSSDNISVYGNQYMFDEPQIKIVLEDGAIAHIYAMNGTKVVFEFEEKTLGTPTAIDPVNAEKGSKAVKTLENGRVVIIRNGERYDLTGRKL